MSATQKEPLELELKLHLTRGILWHLMLVVFAAAFSVIIVIGSLSLISTHIWERELMIKAAHEKEVMKVTYSEQVKVNKAKKRRKRK